MKHSGQFRYRVLIARGPVPLDPPVQFEISRSCLLWLTASLVALIVIQGLILAEGLGWQGPLPHLRTRLHTYGLAPGQTEQIAHSIQTLNSQVNAMTTAQQGVTQTLGLIGPAEHALDHRGPQS